MSEGFDDSVREIREPEWRPIPQSKVPLTLRMIGQLDVYNEWRHKEPGWLLPDDFFGGEAVEPPRPNVPPDLGEIALRPRRFGLDQDLERRRQVAESMAERFSRLDDDTHEDGGR